MINHPDDQTLSDLLDDGLDPGARAGAEEHLAACDACFTLSPAAANARRECVVVAACDAGPGWRVAADSRAASRCWLAGRTSAVVDAA